MRILDIDKNILPYRFRVPLEGRTYDIEVYYNLEHDYFTLNLYFQDVILIDGEKLIYGKQLFEDFEYLPVPQIAIIPLDVSGNDSVVNFKTLGDTVFLYLLEEGDLNDVQ